MIDKKNIFFKTIGIFVLIMMVFDMKNLYSDPDGQDLNNKENIILSDTKAVMDSIVQDIGAKQWHTGTPRTKDWYRWTYLGAYINMGLSDCITANKFEEALLKNGFKHASEAKMGGYYCRGDVTINTIHSEDSYQARSVDDRVAGTLFMCGKIRFTLSWKEGKNKNNPNCALP